MGYPIRPSANVRIFNDHIQPRANDVHRMFTRKRALLDSLIEDARMSYMAGKKEKISIYVNNSLVLH
jgi:hypothetical protein